jgi:hypothetical protein
VKTNGDPGVLDRAIADLRERFALLKSYEATFLPAVVPTEDDIDAAIRAARRTVRTHGGHGANFAEAQSLLAQAKALQADAACPNVGA